MTADVVVTLLTAAGVACTRMRTPGEFFAHPRLRARDRWRPVDSPGGPVLALAPRVSVPGREPLMRGVPALGQHNAAIRAEFTA
jgi:crotonobetainyl-CoA:carnitine CoA-transferase CaiB-like acyl-CoA transferase